MAKTAVENGDRKEKDISQKRRSQLTKAAYKVVGRMGYYNFTIRDIARESGLSAGLVHYYFKDKQDLLLHLLREMNSNLKNYLHRALRDKDNPADKLVTFCDQAFNLVETEKDYFYVLIDFWTQINHNARIKKANEKLFWSYREEIGKILKEGVEKDIFVEIDIDFSSTIIISLIQGTIIQYVIDRNAFDYAQYVRKIKDMILSLVLKNSL